MKGPLNKSPRDLKAKATHLLEKAKLQEKLNKLKKSKKTS
jgi:hypothetical protein